MGFATVLAGQDQLTATRVWASSADGTPLADAMFQVDGQWYSGGAQFSWPAGSKHLVAFGPIQYVGPASKTRYEFVAWTSSNGPVCCGNVALITADSGVSSYNLQLKVKYALTLSYYPCTGQSCLSPGTICVNGITFEANADIWLDPSSTVLLEAKPNPGWVFGGWQQGADLPAIYSFTLNAPTIVYPKFVPARAVTLSSSPDGLQLLADRAQVTAPTTLEWGWTTTHTVGVVSPQRDKHGVLWLFQSWSDSGALTHSYQVESTGTPAVVTAQFERAVGVMVTTDPVGLSVLVDGASLTAPVSFEWLPGSVHTVAAVSTQTDAGNAPWTLRAWSNGGTASQTIQVSAAQADTGIRLTAIYDPLSGITVDSAPRSVLRV